MLPKEFTYDSFLSAAATDAQGRMPLWLIVDRVIAVATSHANILGIGYDTLKTYGIGWVLARLSIEMTEYPTINQNYSMTTWIEGFNRLYSDRCFVITDSRSREIGHTRSMWVAIDVAKRTAADLTVLDLDRIPVIDRNCPVKTPGKMLPLPAEAIERKYTFAFCDIDVNRHVNTVQYVRHILNQWPMEQYDSHEVGRFDIQFHNECYYGDTVTLRHLDEGDTSRCDIVDPQGRRAVTAAIRWRSC